MSNIENSFPSEFHFSTEQIFSNPEILLQKKITQLTLCDDKIFCDKDKVLRLIRIFEELKNPIYVTFCLELKVLDKTLINEFCKIPCCLQFEFLPSFLDKDKKFVEKKVRLLNDSGLVFGFEVDAKNFASIKSFKLMLDEIVNFYPNHVYISCENLTPTEKLSSQDIKKCKNLAFAMETFYSYGRAVPWFLAILQCLKIRPSSFFSDFAEWQECNNCAFNSKFDVEKANHAEIEKMQLNFLEIKFSEKNCMHLFACASDLIRLHGAFSRAISEGQTSTLSLSYHPDDIFSPYCMDIALFTDEVCLEPCKVCVFPTADGADFKIE